MVEKRGRLQENGVADLWIRSQKKVKGLNFLGVLRVETMSALI